MSRREVIVLSLERGEPAFLYLTEIVHRRPRQWYYDVDRLHDILQRHGRKFSVKPWKKASKSRSSVPPT
jgi:hypothetical protein